MATGLLVLFNLLCTSAASQSLKVSVHVLTEDGTFSHSSRLCMSSCKKQTANEINEVPQLILILLMTITDKQQINKCRVQYTECLAFIVVGI